MILLVGSDDSKPAPRRSGSRPGQQMASLGPDVPAGTWHAVPVGKDVALCEYQPRRVFPNNQWPGTTRDRCEACTSRAAELSS